MKSKNFLFFVLISLFIVRQTQAAAEYPIPELGSCRDASECKLFCDIPNNTPTCWSYDKYVMNKDILGESTVNLTYPITDLGNCATAQECFVYCNQPKNQDSCLSYARNKGLVKEDASNVEPTPPPEILEAAKTELGCTDKNACMAICSDPNNLDKCRTFAQKHGLEKEQKGPPPEVVEKAKTELGCTSKSTCMSFCQKPENQEKCFAFAKKNNLVSPEDAQKMEQHMEQKTKMMEAAKSELGCDSGESCSKLCSDSANREKCMNLGKKFGMVKEANKSQSSLPCTGESECKKYCEIHPDDCRGFSSRSNSSASDDKMIKPSGNFNQTNAMRKNSDNPKGDFLGPAGCKSDAECKAYCEKHPSECPGTPKKGQQTPNPSSIPNQQGSNNTSPQSNKPPSSASPYPQQSDKTTQNYTSNTSTQPVAYPTKYEQSQYQQPVNSTSANQTQNYTTSDYPGSRPSDYPH